MELALLGGHAGSAETLARLAGLTEAKRKNSLQEVLRSRTWGGYSEK